MSLTREEARERGIAAAAEVLVRIVDRLNAEAAASEPEMAA
jgi:hypothetical protein